MAKKFSTRKLTILCFTGMIGAFSIINICSEKQTVSYHENRTLSTFPALTVSNILGGNFDDAFEKWFSDHFFAREKWIELKAFTRQAAGSIENNGIYFADDDRLVESFLSYNERNLNSNIETINDFCSEQNIKGNILIVPTAAWGCRNELPPGAYSIDEDQLIEEIYGSFTEQNFIRYSDYTEPSADLYFRTDHHWNEKGAYQGYVAIAEQVLNKEPEEFTYELMSQEFAGTMYSKSGVFWNRKDSIYKIIPEKAVTAQADIDGVQYDSIYSDECLSEKDQYRYYVDGNHSEVRITTSSNTGRKALIIKDSYAHILIPYLITEYDEIEMLDLRYYHSPVSEYLTDPEHTDVYFIYSLDNFCADSNLAFLR